MTEPLLLVWQGAPRTKKNSMQIRRGGSRVWLAQSEAYRQYQRDCILQTPGSARMGICEPVNVRCVYYMARRSRVDLLNLMAATLDILVAAGVLKDDNCSIAVSHDGSRVFYDKAHPRAEITITPADGNAAGEQGDGTARLYTAKA